VMPEGPGSKASPETPADGVALPAPAWSGDGRLVAFCESPDTIRLVEHEGRDRTHRERGEFILAEGPVTALALSSRGEWLAAADRSHAVALWWIDPATRHVTEMSRGRVDTATGAEAIRTMAFAPDDRSLALGVGRRVLVLRVNGEELRPRKGTAALYIRLVGDRIEFALVVSGGQLTLRHELPRDLSPELVDEQLRRHWVRNSTWWSAAEHVMQELRRRLVPEGLAEARALTLSRQALGLHLDAPMARYPWELLLASGQGTPLGVTQGLVRVPVHPALRQPAAPGDQGAPLHVLVVSASGPGVNEPGGEKAGHEQQAVRLAQTLADAGEPQGRIEQLHGAEPRIVMTRLLEARWRVLVLVGSPDGSGRFPLGEGSVLSVPEIHAMRHLPDIVLMLGGDFRREADELVQVGVPVCVACGWPLDDEGLWAFFSEWLRVLRGGGLLMEATRLARQFARTRTESTAWALEVHGDPGWGWPQLPAWRAVSVGQHSPPAYAWQAAPAALAEHVAAALNPIGGRLRVLVGRTRIEQVALPWYPGWLLLRLSDPTWSPATLALYCVTQDVVTADRPLVRLDGSSAPVHELNARVPIDLTDDNVLGYLAFFSFFVRGDEGPFYLLESADDPMVPSDASEQARRTLREAARPATLDSRDEAGNFVCSAVVWYGDALFRARFAVQPDGKLEMDSDEPVAGGLSLRLDAPLA
jgi:hypothetical protein